MSETDVQVPDEEGAAEAAELPAPDDAEGDLLGPGNDDADEPGPSDDDATGADETDEEGEGEEPEPEEPAEPLEPATEARLDQVTTALSKAARSYGNRVASIFGDDWMGCIPCPLCATDFPGVLTPAPRSEETIATVRPIIGLPDLSTYREDRFARECERCQGRGKTLTGSRVPQYATMQCPECKGTGFRSAEEGVPALRANGTVDVLPPPTHVDDVPAPSMPADALEALKAMVAAAENAGVGS